MTTSATTREHADLLETLAQHRFFVRRTARGLSDEQAARRSTASELSVGGVIKHLTGVESRWARFLTDGAAAFPVFDEAAFAEHAASFVMAEGETLAGLLSEYDAAAEGTDDVLRGVPDLDATHALPVTPWWPEGSRWTARRAITHLIAETAQHAGHADIIRETIDG